MDDLKKTEEELRQSLTHVPAPDGFTDRVMERVAARGRAAERPLGQSGVLLGMRQHAGWWTSLAAMLALALGGSDAMHVRHQRHAREAAAAQAQVDLAMQLTNHALNEVETGLERSPAGRFVQLWNGK